MNCVSSQVIEKLSSVVSVTEETLDYVAAGLDASTDYFSHTGTQTVARELVKRSLADMKEEVWRQWVDNL